VSEKPTFEARAEQFWKLVDKNEKVEKVAGGFGFTEGPVWDPKGFLYVSDEEQNYIYKVFVDGRKEKVIQLGDPDGSTYDRKHRLIDCASVLRAIIAIRPDGTYSVLADKFEGKKFNSPNDIVLGPGDAFYFTDPTLDLVKGERQELAYQGVFRLDKKGRLTLLIDDLKQPNGLTFSPDRKRLYVDDSQTKEIHVYDVNSNGTVKNGRLFAKEEGKGGPDGMRTDLNGNLYVTGPGGVWIWNPDGTHLGIINVPEQPANLEWGGTDLQTLFFTAKTSVYRLKTRATGFVPYLKQRSK
jgi:gluconolactonase